MFFLDLIIILCTITLTISVNNIIVLINFLSILFMLSYQLLGVNCVEITLLIIIIYSSAFLCFLLMNGFYYINFYYIDFIFIDINSYYDNLFIYFPCIWSVFLEVGWNRFGNVVFDNDLIILTVLLFFIVSFNLKSLMEYYGNLVWLL